MPLTGSSIGIEKTHVKWVCQLVPVFGLYFPALFLLGKYDTPEYHLPERRGLRLRRDARGRSRFSRRCRLRWTGISGLGHSHGV